MEGIQLDDRACRDYLETHKHYSRGYNDAEKFYESQHMSLDEQIGMFLIIICLIMLLVIAMGIKYRYFGGL